jgi:hypothetical protein
MYTSTSTRIIITNTEFTQKNASGSWVTSISHEDLIYTLSELKEAVTYDGGVGSNDLSKDGFIKLKWSGNFEFFKYHFYDNDKFNLKLVTQHSFNMESPREPLWVSIDGGIGYYKRTGSTEGNGSGPQVDLPGAYSLTAGTYDCTLTFRNDGTYLFDHPVAASDRSGTWTQNGGEVTMTYTVAGTTIREVFITTESGNVVTLTLKDTSAAISNILVSFDLAAKSVSLTRQ